MPHIIFPLPESLLDIMYASEIEKAECLVMKQSYVDHGMSLPFSFDADTAVTKSFHRKKDDTVSGKCITSCNWQKEIRNTVLYCCRENKLTG